MKRTLARLFSKPEQAPLNGAGPGQGISVKQAIIARNMRAIKQRNKKGGCK